jgi:hypothetical protein
MVEFGDSGGGGELGTLVGRRDVDRTEVVASDGDLGVVMIGKDLSERQEWREKMRKRKRFRVRKLRGLEFLPVDRH